MPERNPRFRASEAGLYRPDIDGLRALAVLSVMMFHGQLGPTGSGYIGVDIFFVISGYLITSIIGKDLDRGRFSFKTFYVRRIRRIFPALFAMMLVSSLLAYLCMTPVALKDFGGHVFATTAFFANIIYYFQADYFATKSEYLPLIHTWSLSIEEQYYLLMPPLLLVLHRFKASLTRMICVVGAIAIISLGGATYLSQTSEHRDAAFFLLSSRAWELAVGALCALLQLRFPLLEQARNADAPGLARLADLGLAICIASMFLFNEDTHHPGLLTALPVISSGAIILGATPGSPTSRVLSWKPLVGLGLISYSVYLIHQPLLALLRIYLSHELEWRQAALVLIGAVVLGAASWKWIEQPFRRADMAAPWLVLGYFVAGSAVLLCIGAIFYVTDGLPSRFPNKLYELNKILAAGGKQRHDGIRQGHCHFNTHVMPFDEFWSKWDCLPTSSPKIITLGDSISADKSWVLREAGYDVGNLGGAGCPLIPPKNSAEPCAMILNRGRDLLAERKIDGLVLANSWNGGGAVSPSELDAFVDYWGAWAPRIAVFTAMPSFDNFRDKLASYVSNGQPPEDIPYNATSVLQNEGSLSPLEAAGFTIINSRRLLCGDDGDKCGAFIGDIPRVFDPIHLEPLGVKLMAQRIRNDPVWLNWFAHMAALAGGRPQ